MIELLLLPLFTYVFSYDSFVSPLEQVSSVCYQLILSSPSKKKIPFVANHLLRKIYKLNTEAEKERIVT